MTAKKAYQIGREHGAMVSAAPASSEMAWSDLRACQVGNGIPERLAEEYVRGHMTGQAEKKSV